MQVGISYNHQTVTLDGETFSNCEFAACRLIYSGGPLPEFDGCRFDACEWKFEDAAAHTLSYLRLMWNVGAKAAVQTTIKDITVAGR
ncbi:MAG: hypothetical protein V4820_18990 [Pseudomonadota bacterium]|uniref:hypothetical protein n=1 Tax=Phenylobacterium sp. TaxID=1871053 RepID=UPI002726B447|nr:hypothetical protein [Phenylobacterium sp.]MDO9430595.1 hypothetical protein [Phenylobacterium sp.]